MHLTPYEIEKLSLCSAGLLAQRRLARGLKLTYPEAIALISTVILELIRDGQYSVSELMALGSTLLGKNEVMPGVAGMIDAVQIEGTFPDGTKLVAIRSPIVHETGNLSLALYGSFLPVPTSSLFTAEADEKAGEIQTDDKRLVLNEGRETCSLRVTNTDTRPIQIGSHFHFIEANPRLNFDRDAAYGMRLDIPAGTAIRFEPGESRQVALVAIAGRKIICGGNKLAEGAVCPANRERALSRVNQGAFAAQD